MSVVILTWRKRAHDSLMASTRFEDAWWSNGKSVCVGIKRSGTVRPLLFLGKTNFATLPECASKRRLY